jgi:signal recognition particle receptor subunit beta
MFVGEKEAVYAAEPIRVVSELGGYLSETARTLGMDGDILEEIRGLNGILSVERIGWDEFDRVLRVKEKLIRILIASLNSEHAMPLNGLIKNITALFDGKLDERFEFPEVFLERGGFDVVVGNPPYVSAWAMEKSNKTSREILPVLYSDKCGLKSHWDIYVPFILQAINIAKIGGYFSYILPNPICREKYATEIRRYILKNTTVTHLLAGGEQNLFVGVSRQSIVFVLKLVAPVNQENVIEIQFVDERGEMKTINRIQQKVWYDLHQSQFRYESDNTMLSIIDEINKTVVRLGNVYYVNYGAQVSSKKKGEFGKQHLLTKEPKENPKNFFEGKDLSRFEIRYRGLKLDYIPQIMYGPRVPELFESPKLIVRHISGNNDTLISTVDYSGYYCDHGIILLTDYKNLKPEDRTEFKGYAIIKDHNYTPEFILCLLNSKLLSFFYRNVYATRSLQGSYSHVYPKHVRDFPLPNCNQLNKRTIDVVSMPCRYILFLNATEERKTKSKDIIEFFDAQIADSLVYELYFHEKFHEDGLYPEPKEYLLELVSKHLKPIEYNRWAELHWKKQLEEKLTPEEGKKLEELETENTKTIESVHNAIANDESVQKQIEKIKGHEWVKVVEGCE